MFNYLQETEEDCETFSSRFNDESERADFMNELKYPPHGFTWREDAVVQFDLPRRIEREPDITLSDVVSECHRIENLEDTVLIQNDFQTSQSFIVLLSTMVNHILPNGELIQLLDFHQLVGFSMSAFRSVLSSQESYMSTQ
ncbi:unnamed protein product [Hymenolepis diminuta]|uniref:Uncharacterized protein n=1 Tax=Hymenolepis diminuta TaxID=6216 RepID=A0A564YHG5_HYMDI|nr:unnamed protein product [Hymenolepis diminuta]